MKKIILSICLVFLFIWSAVNIQPVEASENGLIKVEATAYYDIHNYGHGATGEKLISGLTLAGKKEWLGYSAVLYSENMEYLGIYTFTDTGYGQSTGRGQSKILKGRSVGTIENGTCIDIYFDSYADCVKWGRRKVYMQLIKAVG